MPGLLWLICLIGVVNKPFPSGVYHSLKKIKKLQQHTHDLRKYIANFPKNQKL